MVNTKLLTNNINNDATTIGMKSIDIVNDKNFENSYNKTITSLVDNLSLFITSYITIFLTILFTFFLKGYLVYRDKYVRGATIVPLKLLNGFIRKYNKKQIQVTSKTLLSKLLAKYLPFYSYFKKITTYKIANAIYPLGTETLHTIITGASGSGKTVLITDLIQQIRDNGDRAIIYDRMGAFVSKFYNGSEIENKMTRMYNDPNILPNRKKELKTMFELERDTILNPLDTRSPYWSVFNEVRNNIDFNNIASALIPEGAGNIDPFWNSAARMLFSNVANQLKKLGKISNKDLIDKLLTINLSEAAQLVKGTPAQAIIDENNPKTALSVMAMISTNLQALTTLRDRKEIKEMIIDKEGINVEKMVVEKSFSIREWINNEEQKGFLFLSSRADMHETLKPLISTWLDIAINSLLSLEQSNNRKIWIIIDELPSLHYLPSLHTGLAEARQFGGCFVLSLQLMAQLEAIYGTQKARATSGLCRNRIILNTPDEDTARWCSDNLGKVEIKESKESISFGASEYQDGVNVNQQDIQKNIVLPTEIMQLSNLKAYIKFAGDFPITLNEFKYKNVRKKEERYIERKDYKEEDKIEECIENINIDENTENKVNNSDNDGNSNNDGDYTKLINKLTS
ncbi:MAG: type IV secretion system DNA-binding domain-containing protein [Endomicrobium sp.]|nr:type IV secretion system DNA-binding domain-containing protein [Endomicrobium sp.]